MEILCLRQYYLFSRRNLRYFKIALFQYLYSFVDFHAARTMRYGFCALQWVDDYLDEDRPCEVEPLVLVRDLREAIANDKYDQSDLHRLMRAFLLCFANKAKRDEVREEVLSVLDAMMFDRERVLAKKILSSTELLNQHRKTFKTSLNLTLLGVGSSLRVKDMPEILDIFAWCSTVRDLEEDLSKNLINVPSEVVNKIPEFEKLSVPEKIQNPVVQNWLSEETQNALKLFALCEEKLVPLRTIKGSQVFAMFLKSMKKYAVQN